MSKNTRLAWSFLALGAGTACIVALFQGNGALLKRSIVTLVVLGGLFLAVGAYGVGWFRAPYSISRTVKLALVLALIWTTMLSIGYFVWPQDVMITPQTIVFGRWAHENNTFTIRNASSSDLYSIEIKFKSPVKISSDEYEFDVSPSSRKPILPGSDFADMGAMTCVNDDGFPIVLFVIHHLEPGERREIEFTHRPEKPGTIDATITSFTNIPQPKVKDLHTLCEHWSFPGETVHCSQQVGFSPDPNAPRKKMNSSVRYDAK